jgi:hypothetical protein
MNGNGRTGGTRGCGAPALVPRPGPCGWNASETPYLRAVLRILVKSRDYVVSRKRGLAKPSALTRLRNITAAPT